MCFHFYFDIPIRDLYRYVNVCIFEDRFIICFFSDCECLIVTVCFSQSWWPFVHAETWCACAAGTSCDIFHDHGSTCITESYNYLELTVKAPENRSTTQKGNVIFQLLASGRLRAIPKFEIFAPKHYGWIGGRMTPVFKGGMWCWAKSARCIQGSRREEWRERDGAFFNLVYVVLNIEYTNTYYIYIYYTYLPIFICVCMTVISSLQSARPFCEQVPFITYDPWPRITVEQWENSGWLGYVRDDTTQSCGDYPWLY